MTPTQALEAPLAPMTDAELRSVIAHCDVAMRTLVSSSSRMDEIERRMKEAEYELALRMENK